MTTEVQIIEAAIVRPGDTVMLSQPPHWTADQMNEIATHLRERLGDEVGIIFVAPGAQAYVLRPGQAKS